MIKSTIISRASDGLILCETNDYSVSSPALQSTKHDIKKFQRQTKSNEQTITLRQIESSSFGVYFKQTEGVIYTVVTDTSYPIKLANSYLQSLSMAFNDQLKNVFAGANIRSKLETIDTSHYFVRFDKVVKQRKQEYEDVKSSKNMTRLKNQLQNIKEVMKVNLQMMNDRTKALNEVEESSRKVSQQAKAFKKVSKELAWSTLMKKYLFWAVLFLMVVIVGYLKFF